MLAIHLFGQVRISFEGTPISLTARPKVLPLLGYLLLRRRSPLARETVANALWPDDDPVDARTNLRRHLHYLTSTLPGPRGDPWLTITPSTVQWNPSSPLRLDVAEFESASASPGQMHDAIALYDGELLEEFDEEWVLFDRDRLRSAFLRCLTLSVGALRAKREYGGAIAAAHTLLAHDPWREDTIRAVIAMRFESGDRAGALDEYERFAAIYRAEFGTEPMAETTAAYLAVKDGRAPPGALKAHRETSSSGAALPALGPFVGRDDELSVLRRQWDRAAGGKTSFVFVAGETGIGKTRLLREWIVECEGRGGCAFGGAATSRTAPPYEPLVGLLRSAAPLLHAGDLAPVWVGPLARLVPELAAAFPAIPVPPLVEPARERTRLFEGCAAFFEALSARRATCLVLDDVHMAGLDAIALLGYIGRRLSGARLLVIVAYRDDEVEPDHALRELRRQLERESVAVRIAMRGLAADAVAEIVGAAGGAAAVPLASAIHGASDGNPFFVEELLADRRENDDVTEALPSAVRTVLERRIARLDDAQRTIGQIGSVAGSSFDVELVTEVTGWRESDVTDAIGTLVDRRLLRTSAMGGFDYAFRHQLIQLAFYRGLSAQQRFRYHARIAQVMQNLNAARLEGIAAELASHWERGGAPETAVAFYLMAARAALRVYANDDALRHLERVLALATTPGPRFDALALREELRALLGERASQAADLEQLAGLADTLDDEDARCTVLRRGIALANVTGDRERERELIDGLGARVERSGSRRWEAVWLEARAQLHRSLAEFDAARSDFERLIGLVKSAGDRGSYLSARLAYADTLIFEGRVAEAIVFLEEARTLAEGEPNEAALIRTLMTFSRAALVRQDYDAMAEFAREAYDRSRAIGDREGEAMALHNVANGLVYEFRIDETAAAYEQALRIYQDIGHRVGIAGILTDTGLFRVETGLLDEGLVLLRRAAAIADEIGFLFVSCVARINEAYALRLAGRLSESRDAAVRALAFARTLRSAPLESAALGTLGVAESGLGTHEEAIHHLRVGVELRRPGGPSARLGDNVCALAHAQLLAGDTAAALASAEELLALYEERPRAAPQPTEWLWVAATISRASGDEKRARALFEAAAAIVEERARRLTDPVMRDAFMALPFNRAAAAELRGARLGLRTPG